MRAAGSFRRAAYCLLGLLLLASSQAHSDWVRVNKPRSKALTYTGGGLFLASMAYSGYAMIEDGHPELMAGATAFWAGGVLKAKGGELGDVIYGLVIALPGLAVYALYPLAAVESSSSNADTEKQRRAWTILGGETLGLVLMKTGAPSTTWKTAGIHAYPLLAQSYSGLGLEMSF